MPFLLHVKSFKSIPQYRHIFKKYIYIPIIAHNLFGLVFSKIRIIHINNNDNIALFIFSVAVASLQREFPLVQF